MKGPLASSRQHHKVYVFPPKDSWRSRAAFSSERACVLGRAWRGRFSGSTSLRWAPASRAGSTNSPPTELPLSQLREKIQQPQDMKKGGWSVSKWDRQSEWKRQRESRSYRGCSRLISLHRSPSAGHPWWDDITALCQMTKKALTPQEAKCNPMNPGNAIIPQKALKVLSLSLWWLVELLSVPSWLKLTLMFSKDSLWAFEICVWHIYFLSRRVSSINAQHQGGKGNWLRDHKMVFAGRILWYCNIYC